MALEIIESCVNCWACAPLCPNKAIYEAAPHFLIDADKCTECVGSFASSRCAEVCPVDACQPNPDHRERREDLLARWRSLHPGKTPATM